MDTSASPTAAPRALANPPFHLAFPIRDVEATRRFFGDILECEVGRASERWIDFDFFGHQITGHVVEAEHEPDPTNPVDGDRVPVPHFGVVLDIPRWDALVARLEAHGIAFEIGPRVRFAGEVGEQRTVFVRDPSGNALEFKAFADYERLFASE